MPLLPNYADGQVWDAAKVNPMTRGINMALTECTSGTRPVAIAEGHRIWETDTNRELIYDGTGWIITYEPVQLDSAGFAFGGFTGGGLYGRWRRSQRRNGFCRFEANMQFAAAPSGMANPQFTVILPYEAAEVRRGSLTVIYSDNNGSQYVGYNHTNSTPTAVPLYATQVVTTPYVRHVTGGLSLTIPFAWDANDEVTVTGEYEMASRYS